MASYVLWLVIGQGPAVLAAFAGLGDMFYFVIFTALVSRP